MKCSGWGQWMAAIGGALALQACGGDVLEPVDELPPEAETWNAANNPSFVDPSFVYDVAALPVTGKTPRAPTPADYWPTFRDSINVRWDGPSSLSPAEKIERALGKPGFARAISDHFGIGSGARKACSADLDCADQHDGSVCATPRDATSINAGRCIPTWWGICHGWAPFAFAEPAPVNPVTKNGVTFWPGDLEAVMSLVYSQNLPIKFLSTRCDKIDPQVDTNGRLLDGECRDMNPGTLHVLLSNLVGLRHTTFVENRIFDIQVWNQPIRGFDITNAVNGKLAEISKAEAIKLLGLGLGYRPLLTDVDLPKGAQKSGSLTATVAGDLLLKMTGSGDADLYVKKGQAPSTSSFDCRPYTGGSNEECKLTVAVGDQVFWMIDGFAADSKISLALGTPDAQAGSYVYDTTAQRFYHVELDVHYIAEAPPAHVSHAPLADQYTRTDHYSYVLETDAAGRIQGGEWAGASKTFHPMFAWWPTATPQGTLPGGLTYAEAKALNDQAAGQPAPPAGQTLFDHHAFRAFHSEFVPIGVPGGATLTVDSDGTGDVDLYVRLGLKPTLKAFTARSATAGTSKEHLSVTAPAAGGTYYVRVRPNAASVVTVTAQVK